MSEPARRRMTSDEFIAWAMEQGSRYELVAGEVVGMAPERSAQSPSSNRTAIHHARGDDGNIFTRIVREGPILLESPGITLADCFPPGAG